MFDSFVYGHTVRMDEPKKSSSKIKSSTSSTSSNAFKSKKDGKEKEEYSSEFLRVKLREIFNHSDFKSNLQKDAIKEILKGKRDVFVSMPTGSGKSLCYQLPGMLHDNKITIVFSPLIALIKDQMDHLTKLKICAESLNSKMTVKERERVIIDLRSIKPNTKFLYITPEQAATDFFRGLLDSIVKYNKLALVAVDECHCVSEMGHQFRKDYLKLGQLRLRYPTIKWVALTATASKDVTDDVFKQLALKEPKSFKTPCFRKNLFYDIIYKNSIQDDYIHLKEFILKCLKSKTPDEKPSKAPCGIIYCRTRDSVERVAAGLTKQNVPTKAYHAGLNDKDRKQTQEDWTNGKFPVICATNSFGMGVDKSSVRFVIHWDVPQNIAAYYQESGRAGRDGKPSFCRLYYCRQEVKTIGFLLNQQLQKDTENVKSKRSIKEFDKLVAHCESLRCRHLLFSHYFGDQAPDCKKRKLCDVCKDPKMAEKTLETFHRLAMNSFSRKIMNNADFDDSDLYEGGRNAVREAEASYGGGGGGDDDDADDFGSTKRDAKAKKETTNLIQKEFERRKQKIELAKKLEQTQTRSFGIRIRSSIHTSKIPGLDVKKRESYLDYLLKAIKENAEKATEKSPNQLKSCDFEDIAAELEYNCFTKNRVLAMYTKALTVERLRIDRSTKTKELLPEIKNHVPKKRVAHGGSSEVMQRDLNEFMKEHNIQGNSSNVTDTSNTNTHTNVGFQTARQINNKLKEPNRMKKDPLTQMSINSFFSAASIKREPEDRVNDNENEVENAQQAKRRRVENEGVTIKTEPIDSTESVEAPEPMETTDHELPIKIKGERIDYDSDGGTEKGSDDEMATEASFQSNTTSNTANVEPKINQKTEPNRDRAQHTQNPANTENLSTNPVNVKIEPNFEEENEDTDEAGDDEDDYRKNRPKAAASNKRKKTRSERDQQKKANSMQQNDEVPIFGKRRIETQPVLEEEATTMVVAQPGRFEENIKNEPDDDPIQSDIETDDENQYNQSNTSQYYNQNSEQQVQNTHQSNDARHHFQSEQRHPKSSVPNSAYQEPSTSSRNYQQPSTSNRGHDTLVTASTSRRKESNANTNSHYPQREDPLYTVGSKSSRQVYTADGMSLLRFNQLEPVIEAPPTVESVDVNNDAAIDLDDIDDLADEIAKYRIEQEKQLKEEMEQLKSIKLDSLDPAGRIAFINRLNEFEEKRRKIVNDEMNAAVRKSEEENEQMRDTYMVELFGMNFNLEHFDQLMHIKSNYPERSSSKPDSSSETGEEKKKRISYNEFMAKPNVKSENAKTMKQHSAFVELNDHIHRMHKEKKLHTIPQKVIDSIKDEKTIIKNKVDRYLMPHYKNGAISKKNYSVICAKITEHHFKTNDHNPDSIRQRVERMVKAAVEAQERHIQARQAQQARNT